MLVSFLKKLQNFIIKQVHQAPLNPNTVVLAFEFKLLECLEVEIFYFWHIFPRKFPFRLRWLNQINVSKMLQQYFLGHSALSRTTVDGF
jgi:hypothetical protein